MWGTKTDIKDRLFNYIQWVVWKAPCLVLIFVFYHGNCPGWGLWTSAINPAKRAWEKRDLKVGEGLSWVENTWRPPGLPPLARLLRREQRPHVLLDNNSCFELHDRLELDPSLSWSILASIPKSCLTRSDIYLSANPFKLCGNPWTWPIPEPWCQIKELKIKLGLRKESKIFGEPWGHPQVVHWQKLRGLRFESHKNFKHFDSVIEILELYLEEA